MLEDWKIYSWYCPNCKNEVAGLKNNKNQIRVRCSKCGAEMVGYEQYGIITELSESELNEKYKDIIEGYSPYILLDLNYKAARDEYRKNEKKHSWRATNTQDAFGYEDDEMEHFHHELIGQSVEEQFINDYEKRRLMEAIDSLPEAQKRRIYLHFFLGY